MKKFQLGIMILLVASCFTACKGGEEQGGNALTSLEVRPATITMQAGETKRLVAVYKPSNVKVDLEWTIDFDSIATINKSGEVNALRNGNATVTLTDKISKKTATCAITIANWEDMLVFNQACPYQYQVDSSHTIIIKTGRPDMGDLKGFEAESKFMVFSEGLSYNANGMMDGPEKAALIIYNCKVRVAPIDSNKTLQTMYPGEKGNVGFILGGYYVNAKDTAGNQLTYMNGAPSGITDEKTYTESIRDYFNAVYFEKDKEQQAAKATESLKKALATLNDTVTATLRIMTTKVDETTGKAGYTSSRLEEAFVKKAKFYIETSTGGSSKYMCPLSYVNVTADFRVMSENTAYGVALKLNSDTTAWELEKDAVQYVERKYEAGTDPSTKKETVMQPILLPEKQPVAFRMNLLKTDYSDLAFARFLMLEK